MCDLFEIQDNNINYYHCQPGPTLLSYISNTSHIYTVVIITHYKRMGYVMIHKPKLFTPRRYNSRCRRFDLSLFRRFDTICRRYDRSYRRSGYRRFDGVSDQLNTRAPTRFS